LIHDHEVALPAHHRITLPTIANWNDNPKPFIRHKTADEILDSLAAYCQRINDSGH
jgi:hypothetical protein